MEHDPTKPPAEQEKAKGRFLMITAMRMGGVIMILAGIAVHQQVLPLPQWTAYLLIGLGLVEAFVVPQMLARIWSTRHRNPPR